MRAELLSTSDPRWYCVIRSVPHDVYHLPDYVEVSARYEWTEGEAVPAAFYLHERNSFCLIPVILRSLPSSLRAPLDWRDATSPYGYAAPLFQGDATWVDSAIRAFRSECQNRNIVSAFIRLHPLLDTPATLLNHGEIVRHGETVHIDLTLSDAELWRQTRERLRSYINRSYRAGFRARFDDWAAYTDFIRIYAQTMDRLQADEFYKFPKSYFLDLKTKLYDCLHLCTVVDASGDLACAALLTATNGIVQYHLSGTADKFLQQSPSKLMMHEMRSWAHQAGYKVLHLGGGLGGQTDSLLQFKAGFSPQRSVFCTYRVICDEAKYAYLCSQRSSDEVPDEYFPRYRKPG